MWVGWGFGGLERLGLGWRVWGKRGSPAWAGTGMVILGSHEAGDGGVTSTWCV